MYRVANIAKSPMCSEPGPPGRLVSCASVYSTRAKVSGSIPTGGILSQVRACVISFRFAHFAHSLTAQFGPCVARTWVDGPRFRTHGDIEAFSVSTAVISRGDTAIAESIQNRGLRSRDYGMGRGSPGLAVGRSRFFQDRP